MQIKLSNKDQGIFVFQLDENNYIKFCPERGGVITNWVSDGKEILYFDEKDLKIIQKVLEVVFQFFSQFVEISIPLVQYLEKSICN